MCWKWSKFCMNSNKRSKEVCDKIKSRLIYGNSSCYFGPEFNNIKIITRTSVIFYFILHMCCNISLPPWGENLGCGYLEIRRVGRYLGLKWEEKRAKRLHNNELHNFYSFYQILFGWQNEEKRVDCVLRHARVRREMH